jgi:hypothetical protein
MWYRSVPSRFNCRYGVRRAGRVIRNMVLATVSRDQVDLHETIAACTLSTVKTEISPTAANASTAATTSSRQLGAASLRSPRWRGCPGIGSGWLWEAPPPLARTRTAVRPIYRSPSPVRRTALGPARWIASPSTTAVTWAFSDTRVFV